MANEKAPRPILCAGLKWNEDLSSVQIFVASDRKKAYGAWIKPAEGDGEYVTANYIMYTLPEKMNRVEAIEWLAKRKTLIENHAHAEIFKTALNQAKEKSTPAPKAKKERASKATPEKADLPDADAAKLKEKGVEGLRSVAAKKRSRKKAA